MGFRPFVAVPAGALAVIAMAIAGCSGGSKPAASGTAARPAAASVSPRVPLPPIDEESALTVDAGRLAVRSPAGWTRSPRSQSYLVRYQPAAKETYPSIVVTAADAPAGIDPVDDAGQAELVAAVAGSGSRFTRRPAAIRLGSHRGVTWSSPAMAKVGGLSEPIDRESFAIVLAGRLYTVEARAPKGKLDDTGRAAAIAVASALSPPAAAPSAPVPAEPAAEPAPDPTAAPAAAPGE
jgi:hypothetical protein